MFLFDTDVVSNLILPVPSPALIRRLAAVSPDDQFTTAITVGELVYGAHRTDRADYFLRRLHEEVLSNLAVLPFDRDAANVFGRLRAQLERAGTPLPEPGLRIAAIALARSLVLVTGNVRHFVRVPGLNVENWLTR